MGDLTGHVIPGSFFIVYALLEVWNLLHQYYVCQKEVEEGRHGAKKSR